MRERGTKGVKGKGKSSGENNRVAVKGKGAIKRKENGGKRYRCKIKKNRVRAS